DAQRKADEVMRLVERARDKGNQALAYELRAMLRLHEKQVEAALNDLSAAMAMGQPSPELQLTYADALLIHGDVTRAEQILWQLVGEWPSFDDAYQKLFGLYISRRASNEAVKVIRTWLTADPTSIQARL